MSRAGCFFLLASVPSLVTAKPVTISNVEPKVDVDGRLMDVHDGNIIRFGERYYWYGMGYRNCTLETGLIPPRDCPGIYSRFGASPGAAGGRGPGACGFRVDHAINIYSSADLASWRFEGEALPIDKRPTGIYFRPKVIYNSASQEYVLWVNVLTPPAGGSLTPVPLPWPSPLGAYPSAVLMVAVAKAATGPFTVVSTKANLGDEGPGDFTLFVDDGAGGSAGTSHGGASSAAAPAYVAYDSWSDGHAVRIERLTDDYRNSLGRPAESSEAEPISPTSHEAPILFERHGWYYLMFGHTCCFCRTGAGSQLYVAKAPLGPWSNSGVELNPLSGNGWLPWTKRHEIPAQENYVVRVKVAGAEDLFMYTGDLWTSAPDGLKSHDLQYWGILRWSEDALPSKPPLPSPFTWQDSFVLDVDAAQSEGPGSEMSTVI